MRGVTSWPAGRTLEATAPSSSWVAAHRSTCTRPAIECGAIIEEAPGAAPEPRPLAAIGAARAIPEPQASRDAPLEGVVLDAATARKLARDEAYRATPDAIMLRAMNGG